VRQKNTANLMQKKQTETGDCFQTSHMKQWYATLCFVCFGGNEWRCYTQ